MSRTTTMLRGALNPPSLPVTFVFLLLIVFVFLKSQKLFVLLCFDFSVPDTFRSGLARLRANRRDRARAYNHVRGAFRTLAVEFRPRSGQLRARTASAQIQAGPAHFLSHLPLEFSISSLSFWICAERRVPSPIRHDVRNTLV